MICTSNHCDIAGPAGGQHEYVLLVDHNVGVMRQNHGLSRSLCTGYDFNR